MSDQTQPAMASPAQITPEEAARVRSILDERARRAARRPAAADPTARMTVLVFHLGESAFAVDVRHVLEVCEPLGLTAIPGTPRFVQGVIALRGRIVAVVDLAAFLGLAVQSPSGDERVVVVQGGDMEFGVRVHAVEGVRSVPVPTPDTSLPALTGQHERLFLGVSGQTLAVLDGERLLADAALMVSGQTARQTPATPEES